jgi:hypothetical protein
VCFLTLSSVANAQLVQTFEDVTGCNSSNIVLLSIYGNVNYLQQWSCYSLPQPPFNPHSGTNRVFAGSEAENNISGSFTFAPIAFTGAWFAGGANVSFQLFLGGSQVATSSTLATSANPTFLASGYNGLVDRVTVVGSDARWVMDDVTFAAATTVTPEPVSLALVASGLALIGGCVRLRRRKSQAA